MVDFQYSLIKVCHRAGREYYHVYPEKSIGYLPESFKDLKIIISRPKFCVISFDDCDITIFDSGRMLIEDLPEDSEKRAREIVKAIISQWHP